jgi:16S rRNA processing protein RimM
VKAIPIGQVVAAHGVRGEVKFRYYNETGSGPAPYGSFLVYPQGKETELTPSHIRRHGALYIIKFKDFDSVERVQSLIKQELFVREEDLPALEEDEYYDYELIGLEAISEKGMKAGRVRDVMHTAAHDILVLEGDGEVLVPMTDDHIIDIDRSAGIVRIKEHIFVG